MPSGAGRMHTDGCHWVNQLYAVRGGDAATDSYELFFQPLSHDAILSGSDSPFLLPIVPPTTPPVKPTNTPIPDMRYMGRFLWRVCGVLVCMTGSRSAHIMSTQHSLMGSGQLHEAIYLYYLWGVYTNFGGKQPQIF